MSNVLGHCPGSIWDGEFKCAGTEMDGGHEDYKGRGFDGNGTFLLLMLSLIRNNFIAVHDTRHCGFRFCYSSDSGEHST